MGEEGALTVVPAFSGLPIVLCCTGSLIKSVQLCTQSRPTPSGFTMRRSAGLKTATRGSGCCEHRKQRRRQSAIRPRSGRSSCSRHSLLFLLALLNGCDVGAQAAAIAAPFASREVPLFYLYGDTVEEAALDFRHLRECPEFPHLLHSSSRER